MGRSRKARVADIHEIAAAMPGAERGEGPLGNVIYSIRRKSFVFFRTARPDAVDLVTGERYLDVIVFWVPSADDKPALVEDLSTPFFTTPHFNAHPSVLLRSSRIGELSRSELAEVIEDAWMAQAPKRLAAQWLAENPTKHEVRNRLFTARRVTVSNRRTD